MTQLDMGKDLRDAALEKSKQGREARIRLVRERLRLLCWRRSEYGETVTPHAYGKRTTRSDVPWDCSGPPSSFRPNGELTADDVWEAANALGFTDGDTRWLGNVTKGWNLLEHTGRYVPSRLKQRHARPIPVYRWV